MYRHIFAFTILTAFVNSCSADCGQVESTDSIGDVKGKMRCWQQESEKMRNEISALQSNQSKLPDAHIHLATYAPDKMSRAQCRDKALSVLSSRGAAFLSNGDFYVKARYGANVIQFSCTVPSAAYGLIISHKEVEQAEIDSLAVMVKQIFEE